MNAELELGLERRIGKRSATVIEKHLGITTVGGLLNYFPRRYMNRGELTPISEVPLDEDVTLIARVLSSSTRTMRARRGSLTDVVITDDAGTGPRHAEGELLQRLPGQGRTAAGPPRPVLRKDHPLQRRPGADQPRLPAAGRGPGHAGQGPGKARRHAHPGVPGHRQTDQLVHPESHRDAAGHRGPGRPAGPAAGRHHGAGEVPAGRRRLPAHPCPGRAGGLAARPGPLPLPGSPGAPVRPRPAPRPAGRRGSHRPPPRRGRTAGRLRPAAAVHPDRRPGRRREDPGRRSSPRTRP